mgnify:CR=1 FL=1
MNVGLQLFQAFLVLNPKALFFIDDQQAKALEVYAFGKQGMRTNDDVNTAIGQALTRFLRLALSDQS